MYKDLNKDLNKDLTVNQLKILAEIQKNKEITQAELAKIVNINDKNIRINIKKLKDLELLERVGNTRTGYWKIKA
jgi:ATP-dependent DNA helicase RecG